MVFTNGGGWSGVASSVETGLYGVDEGPWRAFMLPGGCFSAPITFTTPISTEGAQNST